VWAATVFKKNSQTNDFVLASSSLSSPFDIHRHKTAFQNFIGRHHDTVICEKRFVGDTLCSIEYAAQPQAATAT
jgi:hypothetical protein